MKQIISDIDNKRLSVVPTVEELSAEEEESGVTQELQDLNVDSLSESTNPDETENLVTKRQAVESKSERKDIEDPEGESLHPNAQINKTTKPKSLKSDLKKNNSQRTIAERLLKGHDTDLQEEEIDAEKDETEEMGSRQVEPAEDFDRIIYEYMIIENAEEFKKKITGMFVAISNSELYTGSFPDQLCQTSYLHSSHFLLLQQRFVNKVLSYNPTGVQIKCG